MKAWLIYNASIHTSKFVEIHRMYCDAANEYDVNLELVSNKEVSFILMNNSTIFIKKQLPDFILFLDKDITLASQLEELDIPLYNCSSCISICDNKYETSRQLVKHKIAVPKTIHGPMNFKFHLCEQFIKCVEEQLNYPMVIKESYGSFGQQVYLVNNRNEFIELEQKIWSKARIYQEYIESSFGRDVRVYVVFDQVVATVQRTNSLDFRANVTNGGTMKIIQPTKEMEKLALKSAKAVGGCFVGVDLLYGKDEMIVCEVNSNAHIKNVYDATNINIAHYIIKGVVYEIRNRNL